MLDGLGKTALQTITVNGTSPCWQNYTAGPEMWRNCGITSDWLVTIAIPFQYATGGYFSMFLVSILCLITYIKYHKVAYPLLIGTIMLPSSFFLFPTPFLNFGFIMGAIALGLLIAYMFLRQTREI